MAGHATESAAELSALLERMGVPLAVVEEKGQGKYVQALRDLKEGELLFEERPIAAWPLHDSNRPFGVDAARFCAACLRPMPSGGVPCIDCPDAVFCNESCVKRSTDVHSALCGSLGALREFHAAEAAKSVDQTPAPISVEAVATCVATMAARYRRTAAQNPGVPVATIFEHATHAFNRLLEPPQGSPFEGIDASAWCTVVRNLLRPRLESQGLPSTVVDGLLSEETLRTILGELTINAQGLFLQVRPGIASSTEENHTTRTHVEAAAVFTLQSCFNHSCAPNARVTFGEDSDIVVETVAPIEKGESVNISYIPALNLLHENYTQRRKRLQPYFFTCGCARCAKEESAALSSSSQA